MNAFEKIFSNEDMSRREFLKTAGMGLLALKLFEMGLLSGKSEAGEAETKAEKEKNDENMNELRGLINAYLEQRTALSDQEINENLEKCDFIETKDLKIQELKIKNPWKPFTQKDVLKESLDQSLSDKTISLDKNKLNVIQTNFHKIGALFYGAFYINDYKTIFINQESIKAKKERIEELIYKEAVSNEYDRIFNIIKDSNLSELEKDQKKTSLNEWYFACLKNPKKIAEIPELISRHIEKIKNFVKEFRDREAIKKVTNQACLPHEAFHYFYGTKFAREGYEGPSAAELLAMAIRGKNKRFGNKDPGYAHITHLLKGFDINNDEELTKFCEKIANERDFVSRQKSYSPTEWQKLSDEEKYANWTKKSLSEFLNEYLARIYNGALGNTPKKVKTELEDTVLKRNGVMPNYDLEDIYHEPTDEELTLLKQMKWKGNHILKYEKL